MEPGLVFKNKTLCKLVNVHNKGTHIQLKILYKIKYEIFGNIWVLYRRVLKILIGDKQTDISKPFCAELITFVCHPDPVIGCMPTFRSWKSVSKKSRVANLSAQTK